MAFICVCVFSFFSVVFVSQSLLRLVCDVTCSVILIMRLWLVVHNFRVNVPMKLNVPDLLSK